jgi:hypothetical protein
VRRTSLGFPNADGVEPCGIDESIASAGDEGYDKDLQRVLAFFLHVLVQANRVTKAGSAADNRE